MGQEKGPLAPTEIVSSLEYNSESETNTTFSPLPIYTSSPLMPPLLSPSPIDSPSTYNTMSQHNLYAIIRQQQKQFVAMQAQIQALIAGGAVAGRGALEESNIGPNMEIAKPPVFNGKVGRVEGFITAYRLYLRMKMREATVEEQIQWILLHIQRGSVDV